MRNSSNYQNPLEKVMEMLNSANNSIFMIMHKDRDGNEQPIISMGADHLVNYVNFMVTKLPDRWKKEQLDQSQVKIKKGFAPPHISKEEAMSLGLKTLSPQEAERIQNEYEAKISSIEEEAVKYRNLQIIALMPYIVVGMVRDDTREGLLRILQTATGITGHIDLPEYRIESQFHLGSGAIESENAERWSEPSDWFEEPYQP